MQRTVLTKEISMNCFKKWKINCMFPIYNKRTRESRIMNIFFVWYTVLYFWLLLFFLLLLFFFSFLSSSYYLFSSSDYIITIIIIIIIIAILFIIIMAKDILEKSNGEDSKQETQVVWSTPIHHIKWWINLKSFQRHI